jgi:lysozyme
MSKKILLLCCLISFVAIFFSCNNKQIRWKEGMYKGEITGGLPTGYGEWINPKTHQSYCGFWNNGKKNGVGKYVYGDYTYKGNFFSDFYSGYGELYCRARLIYSGYWRRGARHGYGYVIDSRGRRIDGIWDADTLIRGIRTDSDGVYSGQINRQLQAEGHGSYLGKDGNYYEGLWKNDKRYGFGFSSVATRHFRAGEWKNNTYLGERILYTSERIYGIDISKYQHEAGRKRYSILWSKLRIIHLGTISKKKVNGNVDYPISFIYIKSTQGNSIRNKYYSSDYIQARRHGFRCGAYHFFSTHSCPERQASFFLRHSVFRHGDLPPVLDVEPTHEQIEKMGGTDALLNHIMIWMRIVERRVRVRPILYVSQTFVNRYLVNAPVIKNRYMIWIARYGEYKPDVKLIYWQLCPDGNVRGIKGKVDINVFNGYREQYNEFLQNEKIK